ncbi:hypothetical protein, unlikely [Trypanosoma brucei gambiense DAL972]|uniref:Uncharacterized protein n=1 Tax=Trypanosoma brucei gambiense (strain MHOM/CI/86/DAL972) TaxID=679716 RepID=C9ZMX0_TRYB9|nr:hypothetical protein, unlikely [Trypanosoma brucei gambiense DAL972]CBH10623.1 hypothetical protein, unlikely [Trypanosoma brucei gambiense DAL972]|eukprot:XP_011772912.1 hypothetical protein, unlikely [Trypanosoma brucei gambiense DAL972]
MYFSPVVRKFYSLLSSISVLTSCDLVILFPLLFHSVRITSVQLSRTKLSLPPLPHSYTQRFIYSTHTHTHKKILKGGYKRKVYIHTTCVFIFFHNLNTMRSFVATVPSLEKDRGYENTFCV